MDRGGFGMKLQKLLVFGDGSRQVACPLPLDGILHQLLRIEHRLALCSRLRLAQRCEVPQVEEEGYNEDPFVHTAGDDAVQCTKKMGWPKPSHLSEWGCTLKIELNR